MIRLLLALLLLLGVAPLPARAAGVEHSETPTEHAVAPAEQPADIEVFTRPGCPHCADAEAWLAELQARRPGLRIARRDVQADPEAMARLRELAAIHDLPVLGVPALRIGDHLLVGFDSPHTTGARIEALLDDAGAALPAADEEDLCLPAEPCIEQAREPDAVQVPLLGQIEASRLGLPAFTIVLGLIDGFNPCAMWVLLFLLSLLVHMKDRRRMALVAGTFVVISGLVYFAFMAAWLQVFLLIGLVRWIQVVLGLLAVGIAAVHIKDFFAPELGISLSIPESAKPGIIRRSKAVLRAEHLGAALIGVGALAVLVNMVELLCTAGIPAVYTQVLVRQELPSAGYYGYLALYNLAYMLDDGLMVGIAVFTLSHRKLQEKGGRQLKLLSGVVMAVLGLLLLAAPGWLVW